MAHLNMALHDGACGGCHNGCISIYSGAICRAITKGCQIMFVDLTPCLDGVP